MNHPRFVSYVASISFPFLVTACQTSGPVYQTGYRPVSGAQDEAAFLASAAICDDRAGEEATRASRRARSRAATGMPESPGDYNVQRTRQNLADMMQRVAAAAAESAYTDAWASAKAACMAQSGYEVVSTCISNCSQ
jgi:hypothetical protein